MKRYSLFLLAFLTHFSWSQNTTATIESVSKDGYYRMVIPPEIRSFSKGNMSDIRLLNNQKKEVPYVLFWDEKNVDSTNFLEYKIISKVSVRNKSTTLLFENKSGKINEFVLLLANIDTHKKYKISGSNDQQNWFGLLQDEFYIFNYDHPETTLYQNFYIPYNDYKFLKIEFDDKKTQPVNILKVGLIKHIIKNPASVALKPLNVKISENSDSKTTIINIDFKNTEVLHQVSFSIANPKMYNRKATLYSIKKTKNQIQKNQIRSFELNSNQRNSFFLEESSGKKYVIEIENHNNEPLEIKEILFLQRAVSLVAELKSGENYTLQTGNPKALDPNYDLKYFIDTLATEIPETKITNIQHQTIVGKASEKQSVWQQPWFMWLCIIIAGITLLYFSIGLAKDMKNN